MPQFSFVVIAYNVGQYIDRCIHSLRNQTKDDFEVVVVDDASTDDTRTRLADSIGDDARFRVIMKDTNEGAHLARRTGVLATTGRHVVFVDGDDEVSPLLCEAMSSLLASRHDDIVRFGRVVIAEQAADADTAYANERMFNTAPPSALQNGILPSMFADVPDRITWSIIDCVFQGDFVRRCFRNDLTDDRLGSLEDSYQMFALCACAGSMSFVTDFRGLRYHLGAGVSGRSLENVERFDTMQSAVKGNLEHAEAFVSSRGNRPNEVSAVHWLHDEYLRIIGNEWVLRLSSVDQITAMKRLSRTWDAADAMGVLLDPLIARAEWWCAQDGIVPHDDELYRWMSLYDELAEPLTDSGDDDTNPLVGKCHRLEDAVQQLRDRERRAEEARLAAEQARIEAERARLDAIRARIAAEQAARLEAERHRFLREGTLRRKVVDRLFPEGTPRRGLVNALVNYIRRR